MTTPTIDVRRAGDRFATRISAGWTRKHSFSFGRHYDPRQHPPRAAAGQQRRHRRAGHRASRPTRTGTWRSSPGCCAARWCTRTPPGTAGVIYPGLAQRMSAGTGILHSEKNDAWRLAGEQHTDPVHFVQMWVVPDEDGIDARLRAARDRRTSCCPAALVPVASGMAAARRQPRSDREPVRRAARRAAGARRSRSTLPDAPYLHLFVARGAVDAGGRGRAGARVTPCGSPRPAASG